MRQVCDIELFGIGDVAIAKHLKNIFESGELQEKVVVSILEHTTQRVSISRKQAEEKAFTEYDKLNKIRHLPINRAGTFELKGWVLSIVSSGFL